MNMTHYTELYLLSTRNYTGWVHSLNRMVGITVGLYFIGVTFTG